MASCFAQTGVNLEVLVYDDASTDNTADAVREQWPQCRVYESTIRTGYIVNRNRGFRDAKAPIVFSLDDDAYFSDSTIVRRILETFRLPKVGAVAIPYVEPLNRRSKSSLDIPLNLQSGTEVRSYVGCAHAIRRDLALELDGYREFFVHQREEAELCLRIRRAGWKIIVGDSAPIVHMVSPKRDNDRVTYYAGRNIILSEMLNAPLPYVVLRPISTSIKFLAYRFSWSSVPLKLRALWAGIGDGLRYRHLRNPVDRSTYQRYWSMVSHGPTEWAGSIPRAAGGMRDEAASTED